LRRETGRRGERRGGGRKRKRVDGQKIYAKRGDIGGNAPEKCAWRFKILLGQGKEKKGGKKPLRGIVALPSSEATPRGQAT